jgi:serine/threonine protein kinase
MNSDISGNIIELKLSDSWKGLVVRKWSALGFVPAELTKNPEQVFKSDKFGNCAVLKKIDSGSGKVPFVVKKIIAGSGLKKLVDFLRGAKSLRNFRLALALKSKGIQTAEPVAAFWNGDENIYVTEYIPNSMSLYEVVWLKNSEALKDFSVRRAVIRQVADVIARFHKAGFWHRDSKAGNFIISKDADGFNARLIDLDGIKYNFFGCQCRQIRTLANLAKSLTRFKTVNITDFYRGFVIYCNAMGISRSQYKPLFGKIERATVQMRLQMVLQEAEKFKKKCLNK